MLKILSPIEIKAKTTYVNDPEAFYHRIIGNYSLLESRISEEDLLHISTTPPEIYVSEGEGMTSILNRSERNVNNLQKVEVLNNVLNRIVVSADLNLTYQDRVFITDALYKLGIRDDRRFMNSFYRMVTETKNLNKLIKLYAENGQELKQLVESYESSTLREKKTESESKESTRENNLFSQILERLETGEVYQVVSSFNKSLNENEINNTEYNISGQSYTAQHIRLSDLRQGAGVTENELVLFNSNFFENNAEYDETSVADVKNDITSAVLFDILKNIYHTGFNKINNHENIYFGFEDTFYKAADKVFMKLLDNTWLSQTSSSVNEELAIMNNNLTRAEIELLEKADEGSISREELTRLTDVVNSINLQNRESLTDYESYIDIVTRGKGVRQPIAKAEAGSAVSENLSLEQNFNNLVHADNSVKINDFVNSLGITNDERKSQYISHIENLIENADIYEEGASFEGEKLSYEIDARTVRENLFESILNVPGRAPGEIAPAEITYPESKEELSDEQAEKISSFINTVNADNSVRKAEFNSFIEVIKKAAESGEIKTSAKAKALEKEEIEKLIDTSKPVSDEEAASLIKVIEKSLKITGKTRREEFERQYETIKRIREEIALAVSRASSKTPDELSGIFPESGKETTSAGPLQITEFVNSLNISNEKRKEEYVKYLENVRNIREENLTSKTETGIEPLTQISYLDIENTEISEEERLKISQYVESLGIRELSRKQEYISYLEALRKRDIILGGKSEGILGTIFGDTEIVHVPEETEPSEEEIKRITETVNAINRQNEQRRIEYLKALERVEKQIGQTDATGSIEKTRKDAILALKNPEELMKKLEDTKEQSRERKNLIMNEMIKLFPGRTAEVYNIINEYFSGNETLVKNNIIRPADLGELIYDINDAQGLLEEDEKRAAERTQRETEIIETLKRLKSDELTKKLADGGKKQSLIYNQLQELYPNQPEVLNNIINEYYGGNINVLQNAGIRPASQIELINDLNEAQGIQEEAYEGETHRTKEAREFLEAIKKERQDSRNRSAGQDSFDKPVETIYRQEQTISSEELSEQMAELRHNITRQISTELHNEAISEEHVTNRRQIQTTETTNNQISAVDIERMIESGVKREMNTISNQVINKLERQMRNEKVRRGYL